MRFQISKNKFFAGGLFVIFFMDTLVVSDFPFLRQIFAFLFLTFIPGTFILKILKVNNIEPTEKIVLSIGLSISFLMIFGLALNTISLKFGYLKPISPMFLLLAINFLFVSLLVIDYYFKKEPLSLSINLGLTPLEKAFLIVPILFPTLSIFGTNYINTTNDNIYLMFLFFLIVFFIIFISIFHNFFPMRLYPVIIFLISISLLLLLSLRSNNIIGVDTHLEYYMFQKVLNEFCWVSSHKHLLDSCLSISLLPAIYKSVLNLDSIFLFKILYSLFYSVSPLIIYIISNRYIDENYSFLASCFYMFQSNFLFTEYNARTNIAILFFGLSIMILFNERINKSSKKLIFILFMISCLCSHYSTTYIFLLILTVSFIFNKIVSLKYNLKHNVISNISLMIIILFFVLIFFWYGQVNDSTFTGAINFIIHSINSLNSIFIEEARQTDVQSMLGRNIVQKGIPHKVQFITSWISFIFIGIGMLTAILHFKDLLFFKDKFRNSLCLNKSFDLDYFSISLSCLGLLFAIVIIPNISIGYSINRLYALALTNLSLFFVIGGIILSKYLRIRPYVLLLVLLVPYLLRTSGVIYQTFGIPNNIILNSCGNQYDLLYVHDHEVCSSQWLKLHGDKQIRIVADYYGKYRLSSQAGYSIDSIDDFYIFGPNIKPHYNHTVYLMYSDVKRNRSLKSGQYLSRDPFIYSSIYNSGGSEIYLIIPP